MVHAMCEVSEVSASTSTKLARESSSEGCEFEHAAWLQWSLAVLIVTSVFIVR